MSDTPGQATGGGEGAVAPPAELTETQVMQGIEGLLGADDGEERHGSARAIEAKQRAA